jgi:hypothetical protein
VGAFGEAGHTLSELAESVVVVDAEVRRRDGPISELGIARARRWRDEQRGQRDQQSQLY